MSDEVTTDEMETLGAVLEAARQGYAAGWAAAEEAGLDNRWTAAELVDIFDRTADRPAIRAKIRRLVSPDTGERR